MYARKRIGIDSILRIEGCLCTVISGTGALFYQEQWCLEEFRFALTLHVSHLPLVGRRHYEILLYILGAHLRSAEIATDIMLFVLLGAADDTLTHDIALLFHLGKDGLALSQPPDKQEVQIGAIKQNLP